MNPHAHHSPQRRDATARPATWPRPADSRWRDIPKAFLIAIFMSLPILAVGAGVMYWDYTIDRDWRLATQERESLLVRLRSEPPREMLPVDLVQRGRDLYAMSCAACHSPSGRGVPGIGKDLVNSWFIAAMDDHQLQEFIRVGRPAESPDNTTRVAMPPMGGHDLTHEDLVTLVAYMRVLQDPRRAPELPPMAPPAPPTDDEVARYLAVAGGDAELAEYIASGAKLYASSCAACHGVDGRGIAGNGKSLINNPFCDSLDDDGLLAFIKRGRDPGDPTNTTGVGMPAKGGNPALDDDDILDIIAYIRALEQLTASR